MTNGFWYGIATGGGLGLLYGLASYLTFHLALRSGPDRFLPVYLGGMVVRMVAALAVVTVVLARRMVSPEGFAGAFVVVFLAALMLEVPRALAANRTLR